jgi:hypothetical protein
VLDRHQGDEREGNDVHDDSFEGHLTTGPRNSMTPRRWRL